MEELARDYGKVDILWLDGGWVRPKHTIDPKVDWQRTIPYDQDIDMPAIARKVRAHQPGMLIVDRTVAGEYENYATPEQSVPDTYLPYPWESCMTLGNSWSYVPNDQYKSANRVIHLLTTIVSRNGSLLLNVGPSPEGEWDANAYDRLATIGAWMKVNGEAIYETEAAAELKPEDKWVFTRKGNDVYAIHQVAEGAQMPLQVRVPVRDARPATQVSLLGYDKPLKARQNGSYLEVTIPAKAAASAAAHAWVFRVSHGK